MGNLRLREALERSRDPQPVSGQQGFEPTTVQVYHLHSAITLGLGSLHILTFPFQAGLRAWGCVSTDVELERKWA